jgi:hypothetical protein
MKMLHEHRIETLAAIRPDKKSEVILYGANIGAHDSPVSYTKAITAMIPDRYPASAGGILLGMTNGAFRDRDGDFWRIEAENLRRLFDAHVQQRLVDRSIQHLSVFAAAPQPLLMLLGFLLSDIPAADVYQLHREPPDWRWQDHPDGFQYIVEEPSTLSGPPALVLSLSATITDTRIASVLPNGVSIWRVTIDRPHNDFLKSRQQLRLFRETVRPLMDRIKTRHGENAVLHVFPAVPVAIAVDMGRIIMPKADLPLRIFDELDVPPSKYENAKERYDAVGSWLNEEGSKLVPYDLKIYPQGSFALGTAVRPLGDEDYDVDAVCLLQLMKDDLTQRNLKDMIGDRLKAHGTYAHMLDPKEGGRRCWTLKYADESKFHLDILPAIPDEYGWLVAMGIPKEQAQHAICITDKKTWNSNADWPKSNPQGYVEWFKRRMRVMLEEQRRIIAKATSKDVQDIPDYEVRTPLQRVIQLLKRHRDLRFNKDEDKPISIIITTLAARSYNNEAALIEALLNIAPGMRRAIENRNGVWWVPNPVNPQENFADKWAETPRKAKIFFEWLDAVSRESNALLTEQGFVKVEEYLTKSYGQRESSAAMKKYDSRTRHTVNLIDAMSGLGSPVISKTRLPSRFDVPHRERPRWTLALRYEVNISARASSDGFRTFSFNSNSRPLQKHFSLRFEASTNTPRPFVIYWQVVNTGDEATMANGLRGNIFSGNLIQKETTLYQGTHWIECFIVKDGRCMARSGEFLVNIG